MTYYSCLFILTEIMMLAMTLHVVKYVGFSRPQKAWYILTFSSIGFCTAAEFVVHGLPYNSSLTPLLIVITVAQFSLAPLLGMFFTGALGLYRQSIVTTMILSVNTFIQIVCAPQGLIFYFDAGGYHRGDYFVVYEAFFLFSLLYLTVSLIIVGKRFQYRDRLTIFLIVVILVAGVVPMAVFRIHVSYISVAICASLCYIYYNDLVQQDVKTELVGKQKKISKMQEQIISGFATLIENRDTETGEHIVRTRKYVKTIARDARSDGVYADVLDDHYILMLGMLAPLHDVGKIVIPDKILRKPGKLTPEEFEQMKKHAAVGGDVVREVLSGITDEEYLTFASDIATYHHERWDGGGYPEGKKGDDIPLSARIMALADVYDALISKRCYKDAISPEEAFRIIEEESGAHFDPALTKVFLDHKEDFIPKNAG